MVMVQPGGLTHSVGDGCKIHKYNTSIYAVFLMDDHREEIIVCLNTDKKWSH